MNLLVTTNQNHVTVTTKRESQCITENPKQEILKYHETNENENIIFQNLWDIVKAVLRGNFTANKSTSGNKKTLSLTLT